MDSATLVFGSTGEIGREIVKYLVQKKRKVIVASRNNIHAKEVFNDVNSSFIIFRQFSVPLEHTVCEDIFDFVSQIIYCFKGTSLFVNLSEYFPLSPNSRA